jgi:hypothetical protein
MGERTLWPLKAPRWVNRVSGRNSAGGRGPGLDPKSRMRREAPVRFCEGLGVQFPRATRRAPRRREGSGTGPDSERHAA